MNTFFNQIIDLNEIPQFQKIQLIPIHSNYKKVVLYNYLLLKIAILIVGVALFFADFFYTKPLIISIAIAILLLTVLTILNIRILKFRSYAFRDHDVISQQGFIYKNQIVVPNNRIQHISINQGVFSRMFNLCTLKIFTASTNNADISISGIDYNLAMQYKELILNKIKIDQDAE